MNNIKIGIIGLGYVGLPLAVEFSLKYTTVGFDVNSKRIAALQANKDHTLEVSEEELKSATALTFTTDPAACQQCNIYIVTVPTPIDLHKNPDLRALLAATETVARLLNNGDTVIYESTVYPGATEEVCIPILEKISGLVFNQDFGVGYSPERINPGDKQHRLRNICKITSGSNEQTADRVDQLYKSIIIAGTHKASSIRIAESAKVIENTQRDVNIALINELALIFNKMNIDTLEVLKAAESKWNFLPFRPGLVGGHCIGVDPYYLTHKAQAIGYQPRIILAGREINDSMGAYVAETVIKMMTRKRMQVVDSNILVMGLSFKENCPDIRNTKVIDIIKEFKSYHAKVDTHDPWVNLEDAKQEYDLDLVVDLKAGKYDAIVIAVPHKEFINLPIESIRSLGKSQCIVYDVKSIFPEDQVDGRL